MEELVEEGIQKGRLEGLQKGIQIGIRTLIEVCREFGQTDEQIIKRIMAEYEMPQSEAAKYVYAE